MKADLYNPRQKCNTRFMRIFAVVHWRGGFKWEWGRQKWRFSLLSLPISYEPSHIKATIRLLYFTM